MPTETSYLITGAGRDIGRAIAESLASPGTFIILHHAHSAVGAEEALAEIRRRGGDGAPLRADLTDAHAVPDIAAATRGLLGGRALNGIVHNAAFTSASPSGALDPAALEKVMTANVLSPYLLTDALREDLAAGASIVALSIAATSKVFSPDFGFFAASKAAMECLVRNWAVQFGPRRIRANAVAPGVVDANFRSDLLADPAFRQALEAATALGRPGAIADIAPVVRFLLSEEAAWITGHVIDASGGWKL